MTDKKNEIGILVQRVDKEYSASRLHTIVNFDLGLLSLLMISVVILFEFYITQYVQNNPLGVLFTAAVPLIALLIAFSNYSNNAKEKMLTERNFYLMNANYFHKNWKGKLEIWHDLFYGVKQEKENFLLKALVRRNKKSPS
jgi:hypothetical protein